MTVPLKKKMSAFPTQMHSKNFLKDASFFINVNHQMMENPMETRRKKSSAIVTPVLITIIGLISLALVVIIAGVGIGFAFRNRGNSTNNGFVAPTLFETRGDAVLNARILSGDARVGDTINRRILQDDINARLIRGLRQLGRFPFFLRVLEVPPIQSISGRMLKVTMSFIVYFQRRCSDNCTIGRQTLLANAFKNLTISIGTGIVVVDNATVNLGTETESSAGTLANITAERNQLPLSTSLLPLVADWKQATITLDGPAGSLTPAVVGNQVNQIIHDLNAYVSGETISNQSVIFINYIGTAPEINTVGATTTLTIKLRTLHHRGCLDCNSTLLAALRTSLNGRFASQFVQAAANYQPKPLMNVAGINFVLENTTELTVQEAQTMLEAKSLLVRTQIPLMLTITCEVKCPAETGNTAPAQVDVQNRIVEILRGINKTNTQTVPYAVGNVVYNKPDAGLTTDITMNVYYNTSLTSFTERQDALQAVFKNQLIRITNLNATMGKAPVGGSPDAARPGPGSGLYVTPADWNALTPL